MIEESEEQISKASQSKETIISLEAEGLKYMNISDYKMQDFIGSSNSVVFCYQHKISKEQIIIKQTPIISEMEKLQLDQLKIQQAIMVKNNHPNIVTVHGFCKKIKNKSLGTQSYLLTIMEMCDCNLDQLINDRRNNKDKFSLKEIKDFIISMVKALEYLQRELLIAHRDIKPENILYSKDKKFKLADFDNAKQKQNKTKEKTLPACTPCFAAPEILKGQIQMKQKINYNAYKADIYSLGLCLLYMCTFKKFTQKERCYQTMQEKQVYLNEMKSQLRQVKVFYEPTLKKILKLMLNEDPFQRLDFIQFKKRLIEAGYWEEVVKNDMSQSFQDENGVQSQTYQSQQSKLQFKDDTISDINLDECGGQNQQEEKSYNETVIESNSNTIPGSELEKLANKKLKQKVVNAKNVNYQSGMSEDSGKISQSMRNTNINLDDNEFEAPKIVINNSARGNSIHINNFNNNNSNQNNINNTQQNIQQQESMANIRLYGANSQQNIYPEENNNSKNTYPKNLMELVQQRKIILVILWIFVIITIVMSVLFFFGIFPYQDANQPTHASIYKQKDFLKTPYTNKVSYTLVNQEHNNNISYSYEYCIDNFIQLQELGRKQGNCALNCQVCYNNKSYLCQVCEKSYSLLILDQQSGGGLCVEQCPSYYYLSSENIKKTCLKCPDNCKKCKNQEECIEKDIIVNQIQLE